MKLNAATRNAILDSIDTQMNGGTTPEARFFVTNGDTPTGEAAAILLNTTSVFNAAAAGSMGINTTTTLEDTTPAGNASPVTGLGFYQNTTDADNAWQLLLGIATSGTPDVTMSNNTIATTDTVQLTSLSLTCPEGAPDVT